MNRDRERELDYLIDRELKALTELRAPETLVHRVMLNVHLRQRRPWYRRAWPDWPAALQGLSLLILATLACGVTALVANPSWVPGWESLTAELKIWSLTASVAATKTAALVKGLMITLNALGRPFLLLLGLLVVGGYVFSVGLGTACYRLASSKA